MSSVHRRNNTIVFVANGGDSTAAATRARWFAAATRGRTHVLLRNNGRVRSIRKLTQVARALDPDLVYCVDLAVMPVAVGLLCSRRARLIVDTGDHPSAFLRQVHAGPARVWAARAMEEVVYRRADAVVVRGCTTPP